LQLRTSWIKNFHKNGLAEAGLLLSHLVSPHLTPFDFFFWGYINPAFYVPTLCTPLLELAARIQTDEATVTPAMLKTVRHKPEYIYDMSIGTHSVPIKHLLTVQCR
jgi:hypothetical protein